jgi:hypothetical protein
MSRQEMGLANGCRKAVTFDALSGRAEEVRGFRMALKTELRCNGGLG